MVTKEEGLAWLHNGYFTSLIKTGIIGLSCVLMFLILLLSTSRKGKKVVSFYGRFNRGIVLGLIVAAFVMHGVFVTGVVLWQMVILAANYKKEKQGI